MSLIHRLLKKKFVLIPLLVFLAGFAVSLAIIYGNWQITTSAPEQQNHSPETATQNQPSSASLSNFDLREQILERLRLLTAGYDGKVGLEVIELDTSEKFGISQEENFPAASTAKIPVLAYLYQQIAQGHISREDQLIYIPDDYEGGTGDIQYGDFGTAWSVGELSQKMMKQSDNVAKNMLIRQLGADEIIDFIHSRGLSYDFSSNETTPAGMANLLQQLYEGKIVEGRLTGEIFDLMTNTYKETDLPRYLADVLVAHKTGAWESSVSDAGIVFLPGRPFVICAYTDDNSDADQADDLIGKMALEVYQYETSR